MKNRVKILISTGAILLSVSFQQRAAGPMAVPFNEPHVSANVSDRACWGQATAIFAQMGEMGEHASQQPTPRLGLRNLARALFEAGVIPEDNMESLGKFVASELGLDIDACQ